MEIRHSFDEGERIVPIERDSLKIEINISISKSGLVTDIMKNMQKSFPFIITLLLTLGGCIGQKGEQKADCASGQRFDQRSRECVGAQAPPQPLLDDITLLEDSGPQEIILNYTDPNGSEAVSCQVNFTDSNVWMRAPEWTTSALRPVKLNL